MPILPIRVTNPSTGKNAIAHALLDTEGNVSLCTPSLVVRLDLVGKAEQLSVATVHGRGPSEPTEVYRMKVSSPNGQSPLLLRRVFAVDELPCRPTLTAVGSDVAAVAHLSGLPLPEEGPEKVELLVGMDNASAACMLEVVSGDRSDPVGILFPWGWTVAGPGRMERQTPVLASAMSLHTMYDRIAFEDDSLEALNRRLERMWRWEDEEVFSHTKGMSQADRKVVTLWEANHRHLPDQHYELPIPFKDRRPLPPSRVQAEKRLRSLQRKLARDSALAEKYAAGIQGLLDNGYAEKVPARKKNEPDKRSSGKCWYIPHHAVVTASKPKPRIVFDCAAKSAGICLNDTVFSGPDLNNSLIGVLLRFRQHHVAFKADVSAMFHQVRVPEYQRDYLRFLWADRSGEIQEYRMTAHLFGGTWSPAACVWALRRTATDHSGEYQAATTDAVLRSFYVDDCLQSCPSVEQAEVLVDQLPKLLERGGFQLGKWASSDPRLLESVPDELCSQGALCHRLQDESHTEHALGVYWDVRTDTFGYTVEYESKPETKRGALSALSSVFEPLGMLSPFILFAGFVVQELHRRKVDRDEPSPEDLSPRWAEWQRGVADAKTLTCLRCVQPSPNSDVRHRQHIFCKASEVGVGVAVCLRTETETGQAEARLLFA